MTNLPYYRWYPADAEGDDFYASLTDAEGWTYHRLLNRSWMNDGIPADLNELARILHRPRKYVDRVWERLAGRWVPSPRDPNKLINPRQERERAYAITKSERATDAVRTRYGRRTDDVPRARARADSDSEYVFDLSNSSNGKTNGVPVIIRSGPEWAGDEHFCQFRSDYLKTGGAFIDEDFIEAYQWCWKTLDFEQRATRHKALLEKIEQGYFNNPKMVPRPRKFLDQEWKRPIPKSKQQARVDAWDEVLPT